MPRIIVRKRDDRLASTVSVHLGVQGAEEHIKITRDDPTDVSDAVYMSLMNSHEAPYVHLAAPAIGEIAKGGSEEEGTLKRKAGRPSHAELEERLKNGITA